MCIRDRDNGIIRKLAAYVILGIHTEGKKEVLTITIGDNESVKYWLSVLNELKNRGVKDILIICADGLTGCLLYTSSRLSRTALSERRISSVIVSENTHGNPCLLYTSHQSRHTSRHPGNYPGNRFPAVPDHTR